jgi:hypothetical protein
MMWHYRKPKRSKKSADQSPKGIRKLLSAQPSHCADIAMTNGGSQLPKHKLATGIYLVRCKNCAPRGKKFKGVVIATCRNHARTRMPI